jgi:homocysteine S-methyltransferase
MSHVTTITGSFATQLATYVGAKIDGDPLWSARFNATNPSAVIQTHLDYLEHGAEIIFTNTYQASVEGYMEYLNLDRQQSIELIKATVRLAHTARKKFLEKNPNAPRPRIFGEISGYGAHLHDGSEYTGSYIDRVSAEDIKKWHKVRIDACLEVGVDGLAIETIPCKIEADALVDLMLSDYPDVKFWMSFQCKGV